MDKHPSLTDFLRKLSYVGMGSAAASLLSFPFRIYIGRVLGPDAYGQFAVISSVAMFLCLPMRLGFGTAMVKYGASQGAVTTQSSILTTAVVCVGACSAAALVLYISFATALAELFAVSRQDLYLAMALAVFYVFYMLARDALRALHALRQFGLFEPVYVLIQIAAFGLLWAMGGPLSFQTLLYAMWIAYGATTLLIYLYVLRPYLCGPLDRAWAKHLMSYSLVTSIGGMSFTVFTYTDQLMLNTYMTAADVGIYYAYLTASVDVARWVFNMFNAVFFPTASKLQDKTQLYRQINRALPYLVVLGFLCVLASQWLILTLYGRDYPLDPWWMCLFATGGVGIGVLGLYGWLLNATGRGGAKVYACSEALLAVVNMGLNLWLIPVLGVTGAITSTILAYGLAIVVMRRWGRPYYERDAAAVGLTG
ncbi:oligosaccharide flippase family protein [Candidatus Entotheonella palauensis]|uniref:oligosaccharide flippase family protein n=1 Tax=Candidatus Entotheonella palauensis TaxID=93172 RepID=UPI001178575B|nr:oligosaccharide flippase family protein [Candidatus Entotheonella palauensis]